MAEPPLSRQPRGIFRPRAPRRRQAVPTLEKQRLHQERGLRTAACLHQARALRFKLPGGMT
eukprot:40290-Pyramimonas_sp.AAC.1